MEFVTENVKDGVMEIILNRPERRNALGSEVVTSLEEKVLKARDGKFDIVVLRGSKGFFSSGGDLKEFHEAKDPSSRIDSVALKLNRIVREIREMPSIWIGVLQGGCVGAGIGLFLACDLSVATSNSYFNLGYRRIGLVPDGGVSLFLPKIVGLKVMNEMYLFSRNITADEAKSLGLVNRVVREEELEDVLNQMIIELRQYPFGPVGTYKELINSCLFPEIGLQLEKERQKVSQMAKNESFKEHIEKVLKIRK